MPSCCRTLYGAHIERDVTIDQSDLDLNVSKLSQEDSELCREKNYIRDAQNNLRSPEMADVQRFWKQTIKQHNRPSNNIRDTPYCSPRSTFQRQNRQEQLLRDRKVEVERITRVPAHLKTLPRLLRGNACRKHEFVGKQFCDVLGPETCNACIEFANRRVAREVQKQTFPEVDCTVTTLVAPMLARFMVKRDISRANNRKASSRRGTATNGILKLPAITKAGRFGRAGVERRWEEKARKFSSEQLNKCFMSLR